MVGARMGEQVGEAMLIVGWEAYPEDVAAFIHAHPTQNEALGEAAPGPGRQATPLPTGDTLPFTPRLSDTTAR
jgi:hypothetical protein